MLERASKCLESGGRHLFKASKPCLRSRRRLHASFWKHGASDLVLPMWWMSSSASDHATGDAQNRESSRPATNSHHEPLLDFLYPEKTLAFIRRLSAYGTDTTDVRRKQTLGSSMRQFSTSKGQSRHNEQEPWQIKQEMESMLLQSTADDALQQLLWSNTPGKQELAWYLYSAIPDRDRTVHLRSDMLDYLEKSDLTYTGARVLEIFDVIPPEHRRSSSYRIAVASYIALQMVGPAIQLLEEAANRFDTVQIGFDVVLKRTTQDYQWDLSFRAFQIFLRQAERINLRPSEWFTYTKMHNWETLFGGSAHITEPVEHLQSFLEHIRLFQHELVSIQGGKNALMLFLTGYVPGVIQQMITTFEPKNPQLLSSLKILFHDLRSMGLSTSILYEYTIAAMLDTPRYREYMTQPTPFVVLYEEYRQQYLDGAGPAPTRRLLGKLLMQYGTRFNFYRLDQIVEDARKFHRSNPYTPTMLTNLLRFYAQGGLVNRVHEFFGELQSRYPDLINLRTIISLTYVYARSNDVPGAIRQFKRIAEEFGMVPDTACWNTLLLAFTRSDDLEGALECFNNLQEAGVRPDLYTINPMLDLCAARGDVEAFEALFSRAKALDIPVETDRRARSGYIQAFLNAGEPEGAEAIAHRLLQSWRAGTLKGEQITHAWNLLLSYYAVIGATAESRRIYKQMIDYKIPLDSWTYGGLMRALVEAKQTNAAYKIMRTTMRNNHIQVYAFHYAIAITGFIREGQNHRAMEALARMQRNGLYQTESSRQAALLSIGVSELMYLRKHAPSDPKARLIALEEELRKSLMAEHGHELAHDQPKHGRFIDSPELSHVPQGYFGLVILLYTTRGAYDICKELFLAASKNQTEQRNFDVPIALLTAIMEAHFKAEEFDDVERCWELARQEANRLTRTFHQVIHPEPPSPEFDSITDPAVRERFESSRLALNRRQILARTTRIYIRSLLAQESEQALKQAQRTIRSLLSHGFIIDSLTWNEYIQHLATHGHVLDAFSACEVYLMPHFSGWAPDDPRYVRKRKVGYAQMKLKHHEIKRTSILPRYKTFVVMASAYLKLRRDEANGIGYLPQHGKWAREVLETITPLTVQALDTMPRTGDLLQKQYLADL